MAKSLIKAKGIKPSNFKRKLKVVNKPKNNGTHSTPRSRNLGFLVKPSNSHLKHSSIPSTELV